MNDQLQQALAQALNAIQQAAQQHGPAAAELTLWVAWTGAFSRIVGSLLLLIAGVIAFTIAAWLGRVAWRSIEDEDSLGWSMFLCGIVAFAGTCGAFVGFIRLLNAYAWVGLWRPEVFLAARLLGWIE